MGFKLLLRIGFMTCCTKQPASCRFVSESCNCCTCIPDVMQPCPSAHHYPHHSVGCSCVHPVMICSCCACKTADEGEEPSCHHGHPANPPPPSKTD